MHPIIYMRRWMLLASLVCTMGVGLFGQSTIALEDLPRAARATLEAQAHGHLILAITTRAGQDGDLVYEALVAGERADVELAVDQRGQLIARFILPRAADLDDRQTLR